MMAPQTDDEFKGPQWRRAVVDGQQLRFWADPHSGGLLIEVLEHDTEPSKVGRIKGLTDYNRRAILELEPEWQEWGKTHEDPLWRAALRAYNEEMAAHGIS
jgi:hypothetical protein